MEVRVAKAFKAVPEGEVYPRQFDIGDTVTGRMAEVARMLGCVADEPAKKKGFDRVGGS
ncbi:hypothetical protein [Brucella anthropi]|uniref:hypothetical protein n=1 Tax=Brucella anthropi TaxID=529 RepID=UPI00178C74C7|nr:hypothetical protein [Brucella anthropi]